MFTTHFAGRWEAEVFRNISPLKTAPIDSSPVALKLVIDGSIMMVSGLQSLFYLMPVICPSFCCLSEFSPFFAEWRQSVRTKLISRWCAPVVVLSAVGSRPIKPTLTVSTAVTTVAALVVFFCPFVFSPLIELFESEKPQRSDVSTGRLRSELLNWC